MTDLPAVARLLKDAPDQCYDLVVLTYDQRLLRRRRLVTVHDEGFLVDLPEVTNLDEYWGFQLQDGRCIQVMAAEEDVLSVTGPDLARLAWHIGNRHTPCQIEKDRLVIRQDHVLQAMLEQLGATVVKSAEPFTPEMGAYGTGRPMGHDHGHSHDHHDHDHDHSHPHSHDHSHSHSHRHVHHHSSSHGAVEESEDHSA